MLEEWAAADFGAAYESLSAEQQAQLPRTPRRDVHGRMTSMRSSGALTIAPIRARAYEKCLEHFTGVFMDGNTDYAIPDGTVSTPERMEHFAAFIFWTSWSAAAQRPGDTISYTNNWPHEPLVGNRPTGATVIWTGVSIIMLLAGICAMVWWYASQKEEDDHGELPAEDPLANWQATPSQRATLKYFWIVSLLILIQITVGVITAHYGVEGDGFYGIPLSEILPYAVSPHLARSVGYFLDCHRLACGRSLHRPAR